MKKLLIILMLTPFCLKGQIKKDKYYHAGAGTVIAISSHLVFTGENVNPYKGTFIAAPIASFKEMYDVNNGGRFSFTDIAATLIVPIIIDTGVMLFKRKKERNTPIELEDEFNPPLVKK